MHLTEMERTNLNQLRRFGKFDWFFEVSKLTRDAFFGELALDTEKKDCLKRTVTVKTMNKCEFAVLKRSDYLKVIRKIEGR